MEAVIQDKFGHDVFIGNYVMVPVKSNSMGGWGEVLVGKVLSKTAHGIEIEGASQRHKTPSRITLVSDKFAFHWLNNQLHSV